MSLDKFKIASNAREPKYQCDGYIFDRAGLREHLNIAANHVELIYNIPNQPEYISRANPPPKQMVTLFSHYCALLNLFTPEPHADVCCCPCLVQVELTPTVQSWRQSDGSYQPTCWFPGQQWRPDTVIYSLDGQHWLWWAAA